MVEKSSSTVSFSKLIDTILLSVCVVAILQAGSRIVLQIP